MPRFVILRHDDSRGVHFDLMLESAEVLKTWALPQPPQSDMEMFCEALGDHRLAYLDYEGPISGDRGSVTQWDCGTYQIIEQSKTLWTVDLQGEQLAGRVTLHREQDEQPWHFRYVGSE